MRALILLGLLACAPAPTSSLPAKLHLAPAADGWIEVVLENAPDHPRALEAELSVSSPVAWTLDRAAAAPEAPLDTVRVAARGSNRMILFAGDKRGIRIAKSGVIARIRPAPAGDRAEGVLSLTRVLLVGPDGAAMPAEIGRSATLR